jgi:tetraacyldisaccharide 4'-kinase
MYRVPSALVPVVFIPGLVYEALVRARNGLYSSDLIRRHRLPVPVISIGNITMGGTGKTPLVIYIARALTKLGFTPAILTRGYGRIRSSRTLTLAPGETVPYPALDLGDEPALIRRQIPSSWMGVSKNRFNAGRILSKQTARMVCVLDDGFQHRMLHRDLDIVILDSSRALGSDRIFPRGTLREPVSALRRCGVIVISGSFDSPESALLEAEILKQRVRAKIFYCKQSIQALIPFRTWQTRAAGSAESSPEQYAGARFTTEEIVNFPSAHLVTALGNPERFQRDIRQIGIDVRGKRFFADHHPLSPNDWQDCIDDARRKGAETLITTEKDAVKINAPPDFPLLVAVQTTEISDAGSFELVLRKCIEEHQ